MVSHIHDLFYLKGYVFDNDQLFKELVLRSHDIDNKSPSRRLEKPFNESLEDAIETLETDAIYTDEYVTFVDEVSFANTQTKYNEAIENLKDILDIFKCKPAYKLGA